MDMEPLFTEPTTVDERLQMAGGEEMNVIQT